jgi:erythromycin esterase-like protein
VEAFVAWLRDWNDRLPPGAPRVGFYGLDLYRLWTSIEAVLGHLDEVDPAAADRARRRYACFDHFGRDPDVYDERAFLIGLTTHSGTVTAASRWGAPVERTETWQRGEPVEPGALVG